ncbi:hypothetical protein BANT918_03321 [Brevibacterium antiquum CNRZ 918]|uniref:Secreted protein n=1 Tax=Brevibacterium antiquum CNRZ 918 TaxID=1255637 RepID=A0A2H1KZU1_9MICO|nr:hypothetical protein BANT918_03321 [Brevibacterium antiquum CNRZ 918]
MFAHRFARVAHACPRRTVILLLLAVVTCLTGMTHAPAGVAESVHGAALSAHLTETQRQCSPGLDVGPGPAASKVAGETPAPLAGDSGTCSAGTTFHDGCLTVSPDQQLAAPVPSSIGWPADAPRPLQPLKHSVTYHPLGPNPGSLSINRT